MSFLNYILIGLLWVVVCIGLGLYINSIGIKQKSQYVIGLTSIFISYIVGVFMLFVIIICS